MIGLDHQYTFNFHFSMDSIHPFIQYYSSQNAFYWLQSIFALHCFCLQSWKHFTLFIWVAIVPSYQLLLLNFFMLQMNPSNFIKYITIVKQLMILRCYHYQSDSLNYEQLILYPHMIFLGFRCCYRDYFYLYGKLNEHPNNCRLSQVPSCLQAD